MILSGTMIKLKLVFARVLTGILVWHIMICTYKACTHKCFFFRDIYVKIVASLLDVAQVEHWSHFIFPLKFEPGALWCNYCLPSTSCWNICCKKDEISGEILIQMSSDSRFISTVDPLKSFGYRFNFFLQRFCHS